MRALTLVLAAATLCMIALVPMASADEATCHEWDLLWTEQAGVGLGASSDGALYGSAEGFYVVSDGLPIVNPDGFLFSIWLYQESNGVDGLQRTDEVCNNWGGEGDTGCFC